MKLSVLVSVVFTGLLLILTGCNDSSDITEPNRGSGKIVSQVRNVEKCTGINLYKVGNVHVTQDVEQSVRVEADDNIIDKVITTAEDGTLLVGLNDGSYSNVTVNIYVSLETIDHLIIGGSGNITVHNSIESDTLNCLLTGAGNIILQGQGSTFSCILAGAGNINAENFKSKSCTVRLNGTGNCHVYASEDLDASLNGVGSIFYYGSPKNLKTKIAGVGQIIKK